MTPVRAGRTRRSRRPERSRQARSRPAAARARGGRSPELNPRLLGEKPRRRVQPTGSPPPPPARRARARASCAAGGDVGRAGAAAADGMRECAPEKARGGAGLAASGLCPLCSADVMCAHEREWAD